MISVMGIAGTTTLDAIEVSTLDKCDTHTTFAMAGILAVKLLFGQQVTERDADL